MRLSERANERFLDLLTSALGCGADADAAAALEGLPHPRVRLLLHAQDKEWTRVAELHDCSLRETTGSTAALPGSDAPPRGSAAVWYGTGAGSHGHVTQRTRLTALGAGVGGSEGLSGRGEGEEWEGEVRGRV